MEKTLREPEYEVQRWAAHQLGLASLAGGNGVDKKILGRLVGVAKDDKHPGQHAAWKEINVVLASGRLKEEDLR